MATTLLSILRSVELDHRGAVCSAPSHQAFFWARVELEPFVPEFEMVERRTVPAEAAAALLLFANDPLFDLAARVDPLLDWKADDE